MKMWNKTYWIILLIFIIIIWYFSYKYIYFNNLSSLTINNSVDNYAIKIENIKYKKEVKCNTNICKLELLPKFTYKVIISKEWYNSYYTNINLNEISSLNTILLKKISIDKIDSNITLEKWIIFNSDNMIFTQIDWVLSITNKYTDQKVNINFLPNVEYIKFIKWNLYAINTKLWTYNLNLKTRNINYYSMFYDYLNINWSIIWIVNFDDNNRKINLWYKSNNWNLIVSYDQYTKNHNIIWNLWKQINKIYYLNNNIYLNDIDWNTYIINWY